MKRCVIVGAGEIYGRVDIKDGDFVIAADGGYEHLARESVAPDVLVGDFDSIDSLPFIEDARIVRYPVEKDETDMYLAYRIGAQNGCDEFYIYGGMDGPRVDHTMANFQLLHYLSEHGAKGYLIGVRQNAAVITDGIAFAAEQTGTVSVFCLGQEALVDIEGLKYSLKDGLLQPSFPLGVSNQFIGKKGKITVKKGTVLVIWEK